MSFVPFPVAPAAALALVASTGIAGFTLVNGTPNIISWTAPNDGAMHQAQISITVDVTVAATGGAINVAATDPASGALSLTPVGGGQGVGGHAGQASLLVAPGTTVQISQGVALTAGAAKCFAQIWGS